MAQSRHKDPWFVQLGLERPPEAVVRQLWESLTRMYDSPDDADTHLWAEGPLPGRLAGCLNCEKKQAKEEGTPTSGDPKLPWRTKQKFFVLCGKNGPLN
jgi:hypothetical protein